MLKIRINLLLFFLTVTAPLLANNFGRRSNSLELGAAGAKYQGAFAGSYILSWKFGKKKKFEAGFGERITLYTGANQYYITAPAKLTSGSTGPGVFFKENITANIDSFLIAKPRVVAVNTLIYLGYNITERFSIIFNIDAVGFTLGKERVGNYINGNQGQMVSSKPSSFNALLISDNDLGSLNSELYGSYMLNKKLSVKAGLQFLFTEYTTETEVQQFPEPNDRFRRKSLLFTIGVHYNLDKFL